MIFTNQVNIIKYYILRMTQISYTQISLWKKSTEIILFRSKQKQITKYLNFRISGQKINVSNKVRYPGIEIEQHLDLNVHVKNVVPKLNRVIGILSKIHHYIPKFLLKIIYYSLFNSHLIYACQVWSQNKPVLVIFARISHQY